MSLIKTLTICQKQGRVLLIKVRHALAIAMVQCVECTLASVTSLSSSAPHVMLHDLFTLVSIPLCHDSSVVEWCATEGRSLLMNTINIATITGALWDGKSSTAHP